MTLALIVAAAQNGVIGRDNDLPWRLSTDLKRFKALTLGHHLIMGRKCFESIGRPLPGRTTVVLSRSGWAAPDGVEVAASLDEALAIVEAAGDELPFIAGGAQIYAEALPRVDVMHWTHVAADVDGDVRFPNVDWSEWTLREETTPEQTDRDEHPFAFREYARA